MEADVTILRLRYLKAVKEISLKQSFGLVTPLDVEAKMGLKPRTARVMLWRLLDLEWLGRPYRGCYHLSEKGKKILEEAEG